MNQNIGDVKNIYSNFSQRMANLFERKKVLISVFRKRLESRKIQELQDKLSNK